MEDDEELKMCEIWEDIPYSTFYQEYLLNNKPCILRSLFCGTTWKQFWGIRDILVQIRILGSGSNSGSDSFLQCKEKYFFSMFFSYNLPAGTLSSV
jgi:hypothetical protein